ncbi:PhoX family phosphatase, partial [Verminephrobacter aporrectodeae subsp. tuberculatae]|nr:PhoX family phosphatase [Verminephrobacter aporrectodeae subsp. tuberculatae]
MSSQPHDSGIPNHLDEDEISNQSSNPHIQEIVAARMSRRGVLKGGISVTTATLFGSLGLSACSGGGDGGGGNGGTAGGGAPGGDA